MENTILHQLSRVYSSIDSSYIVLTHKVTILYVVMYSLRA